MTRHPRTLPLLLALLGCQPTAARFEPASPLGAQTTRAARCVPSAPQPQPFIAECPIHAPTTPDALDEALTAIGLNRCTLGFTPARFGIFGNSAWLHDPFRLPWYDAVHDHAVRAPAFAREWVQRLDDAHRASSVGDALALATQSFSAQPPDCVLPFTLDPAQPLATALAKVISDAGGTPDLEALRADADDVPLALQRALAQVVLAAAEANTTWEDVLAPFSPTERATLAQTPSLALTVLSGRPDVRDPRVLLLLRRLDLGTVAHGATRLGLRLDSTTLSSFAGSEGFSFDQPTPLGRVVLHDAQPHVLEEGEPLLVLVDTGGDDQYFATMGAIDGAVDPTSRRHVSLAIDLGGKDVYSYRSVPDRDDTGRLPSDAAGRYHSSLPPDQDYGPVTLSETPRQGAGRLGYGFLLDFGVEADTYQSLRMSQGFGGSGVGVLYDQGGDDHYQGEAGVQGAATFGIGLLLDQAGDDTYEAYVLAQGFAFVKGVGALFDGSGNDHYLANTGDPAFGGDPIYLSVQIPGVANDNFAQGAGFGLNSQMSGGLGVLRDLQGDDVYRAAVYSQSSGYWFGTGILADQAGDDAYDGRYYVQGAGAHFALAVFLDDEGNDRYNQVFTPKATSIGIGHDFTVAWHIDRGGNDLYRGPGLSLGGGNANGLGVLLNLGGDDVYEAPGEPSLGVANLSYEVNQDAARRSVPTMGLFLDVGGTDVYRVTSTVGRGDDVTWKNNREPPASGLTTEFGGGTDRAAGTVELPSR